MSVDITRANNGPIMNLRYTKWGLSH